MKKTKAPTTITFCGKKRKVEHYTSSEWLIPLSPERKWKVTVYKAGKQYAAWFYGSEKRGNTFRQAVKRLESEVLDWFCVLGEALNYDVER